MHINTHVALALLAGTLSNALPSPQEPVATTTLADGATTTLPAVPATDTAAAIDQLAQLANFAQDIANSTLEEAAASKKRAGGCYPWNLSIRREWYVYAVALSA